MKQTDYSALPVSARQLLDLPIYALHKQQFTGKAISMEMLVDTNIQERPNPTVLGDRILRKDEVMSVTGLRQSYLRQMVLDKRFPAPVRLGKRAVGWRLSDIQQWLQSLPQGEQA